MFLRAALALLLTLPLLGQTIHLANHAPTAFSGWKRVNVDTAPPHDAGEVGDVLYVVGRRTGRDTRAVDVHVTLAPGERKTIDLAQSADADFELAPPRGIQWTGGGLRLSNKPMQWVSVKPDGAAWLVHLRRRTGRMMATDVWLRHYPQEPWAHGEAMTTCSNGALPDLHEDAALQRLSFGDGLVIGAGRQFHEPLFDESRYADGQGRAVPFTVVWLRHVDTQAKWHSANAVIQLGIGGVGLKNLLHTGNPVLPPNTKAISYARKYMAGALAAIHDWRAPVASITATSTNTGSQYDQLWRHGEPLLPDGAGTEWVSYLCALKYSNRPCHHLEVSGDRIEPAAHPECIFWQSRQHPHVNVGKDKLGKEGQPPLAPWHVPGEFFGADREHWLIGTLCAGARYTGSPALQSLIEHQANAFLLGETVTPGWSTSTFDTARSVGYAALVALQLWDNLEDRELAEQVRHRFKQRVLRVYVPQLSGKAVWDPRPDLRILTDLDKNRGGEGQPPKRYTHGWMTWQQSLGSLLDVTCEVFDIPEGRALAIEAARSVMAHAWRKRPSGQWITWDNLGYLNGEVLPESEYVEGRGAHRTGWYDTTWCLIAPQIVLRHEPTNADALEIMAQYGQHGSWVIPRGK